jgi:hypothetical protein
MNDFLLVLQRAAAIIEVLKSRQNGVFVFNIIADPDGNDLEEEVCQFLVDRGFLCPSVLRFRLRLIWSMHPCYLRTQSSGLLKKLTKQRNCGSATASC